LIASTLAVSVRNACILKRLAQIIDKGRSCRNRTELMEADETVRNATANRRLFAAAALAKAECDILIGHRIRPSVSAPGSLARLRGRFT
jgi:hypothetical protein